MAVCQRSSDFNPHMHPVSIPLSDKHRSMPIYAYLLHFMSDILNIAQYTYGWAGSELNALLSGWKMMISGRGASFFL